MVPLIARLALLFTSAVLSLAALEVTLRSVFPIYEYAASAAAKSDGERIWRRHPGTRSVRHHPDTRTAHPVVYNALALRQHREIDVSRLDSQVTVGVFGDSFTENLRVPVAYSFTEVVDYLLNKKIDATVLNFGVDGYGTDQSYLQYRESDLPLDIVIYVLCSNDLRNIFENELFRLDGADSLVQSPAPPTSLLVRAASKLHLTYAFLDLRNRITPSRRPRDFQRENLAEGVRFEQQRQRFRSPEAQSIQNRTHLDGPALFDGLVDADSDDAYIQTKRIFLKLLERWRNEVEASGARFVVVGLPRLQESALLTGLPAHFEKIDLYLELLAEDPGYEWEDLRFKNDGHWNEQGNLRAANILYRHIIDWEGLDGLAAPERRAALQTYFDAFGGWHPETGTTNRPGTRPIHNRLRTKYAALEAS